MIVFFFTPRRKSCTYNENESGSPRLHNFNVCTPERGNLETSRHVKSVKGREGV